MVVLGSLRQDLGASAQHDPAQLPPVLVVAVGDKGDRGIVRQVAQPLQGAGGCALRLLVDRDVQGVIVDGEAYRHDVRVAVPIGGREVADAL